MIDRYLLPRIATLALLGISMLGSLAAQPVGIVNGFPYTVDPRDTAESSWLPSLADERAGAHGFLEAAPDGGFRFQDGTPARFIGVTMQWSACFPDSTDAVVTAARLRKLGVNLVRFQYMDNAYTWNPSGTFLDPATGFRTIQGEQMRRFDRFVHELKKRGIYSYITLQSSRAPSPADGLGSAADSVLWLGQGIYHLYPKARDAHKHVARLLLDHLNPFTGLAYKDEPAVAMLEIMDRGSIISLARLNYTQYRSGDYTFSWNHSRRLDTLYAEFLRKKYGTSAALANAWKIAEPTGGFPNLIREGSFEGTFETEWEIEAYDGPTVTPILKSDSVPSGSYALMLRLRNARGNVYNAYMQQLSLPLKFNTLYRLSFRAKCSNPDGRTIQIIANDAADGGLSAGLNESVTITPEWKEHEVHFLVPVQLQGSAVLYFFFGDLDGELTIDDVQLREFAVPGLQAGESLENATVARIPMVNEANYILPSKRIEDQSEFYLALDREYFTDLRSHITTTIGAKQPVTGASHYWGSGFMEAAVQGRMDFTTVQTNWDWVSTTDGHWNIRNYSPLRATWAGPIFDIASYAHARQPLMVTFGQPFPNRYLSESMVYLPAYAALHEWDGIVWDNYADTRAGSPAPHVDSLGHHLLAKNPVANALLPVISHIYRHGSIAPSSAPIHLQHSEQQARLFPRMEWAWGRYALPGYIPSFAMAGSRIVTDSLDARYVTQRDDISFSETEDGEVRSDTRELHWEYNRGTLSINTETVQGATGHLARAGGVSTDHLEIDLRSGNETATVLWTSLEPGQSLEHSAHSLLTLVSRAEPTGMTWQDSSYARVWGGGGMVMDPLRVRLTMKDFQSFVNEITLRPLDATGALVEGVEIEAELEGEGEWSVTIDQSTTPYVWFRVDMMIGDGVEESGAERAASIALMPNVVRSRGRIEIALPGAREDVRIVVTDMLGRVVATPFAGPIDAAHRSLAIDATDFPAGMYALRLTTERDESATTVMTVVK